MQEPFRTVRRTPLVVPILLATGCLVAPAAGPADSLSDRGQVTQPAPPLRTDPVEESLPAGVEPAEAATQSDAAAVPSAAAAGTAQEAPPSTDEVEEARRVAVRAASAAALRREADRVLDDWHEAAAVGARDRYLGHFTQDAVFLGTDATERWDLATFTSYVDQHFAPGKGWKYTPSRRYVILGQDQNVAWFDEALSSAGYGALRGTGALRRDGDTWRIAHYSMTFTIPNDVAPEVVEVVRSAR